MLASFGILFLLSNHLYDATLCFAGVSSLFAFWFYNKPPAKKWNFVEQHLFTKHIPN